MSSIFTRGNERRWSSFLISCYTKGQLNYKHQIPTGIHYVSEIYRIPSKYSTPSNYSTPPFDTKKNMIAYSNSTFSSFKTTLFDQ